MEIQKIKKDADKTNFKDYDTFHRAIGPILLVSNFFALMPLVNTTNSNPYKIRFRLKSFGMIVTCTFLLCGLLLTLLFTKNQIANDGINPKSIIGIVFYSCGLTSCCLFLNLAKKWPKIIAYWTNIEIVFLNEPYEMPKTNLSRRIRLPAIIIAVLATVEHCLFLSSSSYNLKMRVDSCNNTKPFNYENYISNEYYHIFTVVPFSIPISIVVLMTNIIFTIIWNFLDFFIMMISIGISTRLEQMNNRLDRLCLNGQYVSEDIWTNIRNDYVKLLELLEYVDENLASIILLSCINNLYFICVQLLNIFKNRLSNKVKLYKLYFHIFSPLRYLINRIYFWYSLCYLIGRTTFIFLCAAAVNDESKVPLKSLQKIPCDSWNTEVERFIYDISNNCMAFSGMNFFYLTRKLLFGMAGTIVSYELVLLQFDEKQRSEGLSPLCN